MQLKVDRKSLIRCNPVERRYNMPIPEYQKRADSEYGCYQEDGQTDN